MRWTSTSAFTSYEHIVRLYLVPHLGHHQLSKLAPEHVQTMLNLLLETGREIEQKP